MSENHNLTAPEEIKLLKAKTEILEGIVLLLLNDSPRHETISRSLITISENNEPLARWLKLAAESLLEKHKDADQQFLARLSDHQSS